MTQGPVSYFWKVGLLSEWGEHGSVDGTSRIVCLQDLCSLFIDRIVKVPGN